MFKYLMYKYRPIIHSDRVSLHLSNWWLISVALESFIYFYPAYKLFLLREPITCTYCKYTLKENFVILFNLNIFYQQLFTYKNIIRQLLNECTYNMLQNGLERKCKLTIFFHRFLMVLEFYFTHLLNGLTSERKRCWKQKYNERATGTVNRSCNVGCFQNQHSTIISVTSICVML